MRIALTGNPNSGKTTMYNALTGSNEKVGNWAGVTVSKKEHAIKKFYSNNQELMAVDLPGAYSMSPFTSEEKMCIRDRPKASKTFSIRSFTFCLIWYCAGTKSRVPSGIQCIFISSTSFKKQKSFHLKDES